MSILLYGCTTWTLTKRMEKKFNGNKTRILRAILYKSWRQHSTKQQLYGHLPPITKTIKVRRTGDPGHCWRNKNELISDILPWTLHMDEQRQDNQLKPIYNNFVSIQDIVLNTSRERWMIVMGGERGLGRWLYIYIHREINSLSKAYVSSSLSLMYVWLKKKETKKHAGL